MSDITLRSDIGIRLIQHVGSDASIIAAARVSIEGADSARHLEVEASTGLIRYLLRQKHGSVFEHSSMTFLIEAPIFVFREWHRHRIGWSYNETSGRYSELKPVFWVPSPTRNILPAPNYKPARPQFVPGLTDDHNLTHSSLFTGYSAAWASYQAMLAHGIAKEVARAVLPVATYSSMYATCNPRSLMTFLSLRTHEPTAAHVSYPQAEIEDAARQMEAIFATLFPITHSAFNEFGRVAP